jgi:hypothetical protein
LAAHECHRTFHIFWRDVEGQRGCNLDIATVHKVDIDNPSANARLIAASPTMADYIAKKAGEGCAEAQAIMENIHAPR